MTKPKNPAIPQTRKPVTLEFDGVSYELSFGFNELAEAEKLSKESFLGSMLDATRPPLALVRGMLFIALKRAGADYESPEVLGEKIQLRAVPVIWRTLLEAVYQSRAVKEDPTPAAAAS